MELWCDLIESRQAFPKFPAFATKAYIIDSFSWITVRTLAAVGWPFIHRDQIGNGAYTILVPKVDRDGNDSPGFVCP